jgi:hypothetical protein
MTFYGDAPSVQRFEDALAYIDRHWQNASNDAGYATAIGWGYSLDPADYQAMYCLMKGLEFSGIDTVDTDEDGSRDDDWYNQEPPADPAEDFASVIVQQQFPDGHWNGDCNRWGNSNLCTVWALLTLERTAPPPPEPPPEPPPPEPPPPETPFVPEASTLLLLGSGLTGLAGYAGLQWRARRKK